jgi:hypothetical protein
LVVVHLGAVRASAFVVDGRLARFDAVGIEPLQLAQKEQVGDLLNGDERIGHPCGPEQGPEIVDFGAELGGEHIRNAEFGTRNVESTTGPGRSLD